MNPAMCAVLLLSTAAVAATPDAGRPRRLFSPFAPTSEAPAVFEIRVALGEEADVDMAYESGLRCDDATLFDYHEENRWHLVFTGLRKGSTLCELGINHRGAHGTPVRLIFE